MHTKEEVIYGQQKEEIEGGVFGWALFNEKFSLTWLIGIWIIFIGIAVVNGSKEATEMEHIDEKTE